MKFIGQNTYNEAGSFLDDVYVEGNVGIGTATPTSLLHINIDANLGASVGDLQDFIRLSGDTTHNDTLTTSLIRSSTVGSGASHESAQWRIQRKIDATWASWINFGGEEGSGAHNHGLSFGVGSSTSDALSVDEVMRIEPTTGGGNVGIGTTAPGALLHVQASATSYSWTPYAGTVAILEGVESNHSILSIVGSTYSSIWFGDAGDQNMGRIRYTHTDDTMQFYTNNAERAVIDENGSLGLGTSDPEALLHLESAADTALIIRADVGNSGENDNPLIHLQQDFVAASSSGVMVDSKIGIVGNAGQIFTNSLANAAYITAQGSITTGSADTGIIQFATGGNNGQDTDATGVLASARMTILADGAVGIGTVAPEGQFEIASANNNRPFVYITNTSTTADDQGGNLIFRTGDPDANLSDDDVLADIVFQGQDNSDDAYINGAFIRARIDGTPGTNDMPGELAFYTNAGADAATQRMTIRADGSVGIGTTTPTTGAGNLTVNGIATIGALDITGAATTLVATDPAVEIAVIPNTVSVIRITSLSTGLAAQLPAPIVGKRLRIIAQHGFELRSSTPASIAINGGTGTDAESQCAANTIVECTCFSATAWVCTQTTLAGVQSAIPAAA